MAVPEEKGVTLGALLDAPGLALALVAGPDDHGRVIRWAHCTELLAPARYLRGGELVLTVGSALTSVKRCESFVRELMSSHAQALGLGIGDVHDEVPAALREACDRHSLPLFSVPHGVPFQAFTELLAEHRVVERLAGARRTGALVATVLDAMARFEDLPDVLEMLARELGGGLRIVDQLGVPEMTSGSVPSHGTAHGVDLPGDPPGRLVWHPGDGAADATAAIDTLRELARPLALYRRERVASMLRSERDLGRLLGLVVDGLAEPRTVADHLGIATDTPLAASAWPAAETARIRDLLPGAARAAFGDAVVVLVERAEAATALATAHGISCGTGEHVPVADLARSVREALEALALSAARGRPIASAELATVDALLDRLPDAALSPFLDQLIEPLLAHDRRTGSQLVPSLRAFIGSGGSIVPTARVLFLHPNTLRHRMKRVAEISGRDPLDWHSRICFTVALAAWDRQRTTPKRTRDDRAR
ncbi:PucR family transcriptional regulator [Pseudonocardia nigra]|uniref:PucR family transcriptional regulator n=1 Tax=Pseudonocardia nigra TaxID=1921578 RepID=UPI001C604894|nr:PucR family transcriptional regulator [Pseudonocardia nigra]